MKVLHLIMSFNTGGAERLLIDILNKDKSQKLLIINNSYEKELLKEINENEIFLINRPEKTKNPIYLARIIKKIYIIKPNIIHCHNKASFKIATIIKDLFKNIKIIYTIHDTNIIKNNYKLVKKINKYCNGVICISNSVEKECLDYNIDKNKIYKIYNSINTKLFYNNKKNINLKTNKEINIGCIARLVPEKKGQDILIKAFAELNKKYKAKLYLAGDVIKINGIRMEDDLKVLKELTKELNVENKVYFCGNLNNIPKFLSCIDILVLPSRYEGFGLVILEGMASKVPVIASNIDGPKEIIKNEKYGYLFEVNNQNDLENNLEKCIKEYGKTIDYAYKYVCKEFDIKQMVEKYKEVYRKCLL